MMSSISSKKLLSKNIHSLRECSFRMVFELQRYNTYGVESKFLQLTHDSLLIFLFFSNAISVLSCNNSLYFVHK